ncbi:protein NO VEIN domain-containing protein [Streptomyces sp. UC4497]
MPLPPEPVLRAAARWLERLPRSGAARCRALFTSHQDFSDITPTQYEAAYSWLGSVGLLEDLRSGSASAHRRIFKAAVSESTTAWFADADLLVRDPDELPDDALRAASALGLEDDEAFAEIRAVWGKVDTARREEIGAAGEAALVEWLTASVDGTVEHVAAVSDGYGYDIGVHAGNCSVHIEAKATVKRNRRTIYLSRNEFETMRRDPEWELVVVLLGPDLEMEQMATVLKSWIASVAPSDRSRLGRWESTRLEVPEEALEIGVPRLAPILKADIAQKC